MARGKGYDPRGNGWGHAGTGSPAGPPKLPPFKGEKKGACDRTGVLATALLAVAWVLSLPHLFRNRLSKGTT